MRSMPLLAGCAALCVSGCALGAVPAAPLSPSAGAGFHPAAPSARVELCQGLEAFAPVLARVLSAPEFSLGQRVGLRTVHTLMSEFQLRSCAVLPAQAVPVPQVPLPLPAPPDSAVPPEEP